MRCCITSSHEVVQRAVLPSPPSHISVVGADRIEALERDNASLKLSADAIGDSLDEDKEMLQALTQGQGTIRGTAPSTPTLVPCLDLDYLCDPKVNPLRVWLLGYILTSPP